uniref:Uncharacterized protein n=1 Tax=Fibrocapsa japonica TaxID=94617 RepID=A0A7S2Y2G2_9STRA
MGDVVKKGSGADCNVPCFIPVSNTEPYQSNPRAISFQNNSGESILVKISTFNIGICQFEVESSSSILRPAQWWWGFVTIEICYPGKEACRFEWIDGAENPSVIISDEFIACRSGAFSSRRKLSDLKAGGSKSVTQNAEPVDVDETSCYLTVKSSGLLPGVV